MGQRMKPLGESCTALVFTHTPYFLKDIARDTPRESCGVDTLTRPHQSTTHISITNIFLTVYFNITLHLVYRSYCRHGGCCCFAFERYARSGSRGDSACNFIEDDFFVP